MTKFDIYAASKGGAEWPSHAALSQGPGRLTDAVDDLAPASQPPLSVGQLNARQSP